MAVSSIFDMLSAAAARQSLGKATSKLGATVAHLASGKRIAQAMEDIASLSIGTSLQTQVTGLRQASLNVAQASSMLQVADGGMGQIGDILQRMQALSIQANSGVLSAEGRVGLNTEFQQLAQEIDRISGNTNFNGVNLLNGNLSGGSGLQTNTNTATQASGSLDFTANIGAGKTIVLNGVTLTEGAQFSAGATIQDTLDNLASALNSSTNTALSGATYQRVGNSLQITSDTGGSLGNQFTINEGASTANASFNVSGQQIGASTIFSLQGGTDNGLGATSTSATGVIGDSLVTAQSQVSASSTLSFTSSTNIVAGNTISIDDGNGGMVNFTFVNGAPGSSTDIQIGSSLEETLQNAAATMNNYTGANDYGIRQLDFTVNGNSLVISNQDVGNPLDAVGAPLNVNMATAGGTISNLTLNNGSNTGVDVSGVNNAAFTGTIQGFQADFLSSDSVRASIQVGGETYTATITDTTPGANTTVRFTSQNGGFFDVQLSGGNGQSVNDQAGADTFAARLDAAFSGLSFNQNRQVNNFTGTGQLNGASLEIQGGDFSGNLRVDSVNVRNAQGGSSAVFEVTIDGETYRASNIGNSIGANESIRLTSLSNPNNVLTFNNGVNQINLNTPQGASDFEAAFTKALGSAAGGGGAAFQIGSQGETVNLNIGNVTTATLFGGKSLDILSASSAASAFSVIADAINQLTSSRADVGAFQQSLYYTGNNLEIAMQNQEAARSTLMDTDIASESTANAIAAMQQQASIAMIAQTNKMSSSLMRLLVG